MRTDIRQMWGAQSWMGMEDEVWGMGKTAHGQPRSCTSHIPVGKALQGLESAFPYIIHSSPSPARVQSLVWVGGLHSMRQVCVC